MIIIMMMMMITLRKYCEYEQRVEQTASGLWYNNQRRQDSYARRQLEKNRPDGRRLF